MVFNEVLNTQMYQPLIFRNSNKKKLFRRVINYFHARNFSSVKRKKKRKKRKNGTKINRFLINFNSLIFFNTKAII